MVFKPSATLRSSVPPPRLTSGDTVFRVFLAIAVAGCVWTTLVAPLLPALGAWLRQVLGA